MLVRGGFEESPVWRFVSVAVVIVYVAIAIVDAAGFGRFGRITRDSPPSFVWFFGWVVLLLPVIVFVLMQGIR
jgi:hypothetical protein